MTGGKSLRAGCAVALGMVLLLASTAHAANVAAAGFLSACPGPIFVTTDTTLVGTAHVTGDCLVSITSSGTAQLNLSHATLTFTGAFSLTGNASSVSIDNSKITTATFLTLDAYGVMSISGSTLTAGGTVNLPPRDSLLISKSHVVTSGFVTLGGTGGLRNITDSTIAADAGINIASGSTSISGVPSQVNVVGSTLYSSGGPITVGGATSGQQIEKSKLSTDGVGSTVDISGNNGARVISSSTIAASAGYVRIDGFGDVLVEDTKISAGAGPGVASIVFGNGAINGGLSATFRRTHFTSKQGAMIFYGTGGQEFEHCTMVAGGDSSGTGILFGSGGDKSITASNIRANTGQIQIVGTGEATIVATILVAKGANGILLSGFNLGRTLVGSKLTTSVGPIVITGQGDTDITASQLSAMNAGGIEVSCNENSEINASTLTTTGTITIPNGGGSTITASKLRADAGFITATGGVIPGDSSVLLSQLKGSSITVQSFSDTTVTDNKLKATTFALSAAGTCTSTSNTPDVPCL